MKKIMILSCGTNASYHYCKVLKERFTNDFYLIGLDINDRHLVPSLLLLDSFYKVPFSDSADYTSVVEEIMDKEKPDFIIPSLDVDQHLFFNESPLLRSRNIISLSTPKETLPYYEDKETMLQFVSKNGVPVADLLNVSQCSDAEKYFIKPKEGFGSIGAKVITGQDLRQECLDKVLIQKLCHGPEITVECFSFNSFFSCVCRERIDVKSGVCTKARVFSDSHLSDICYRFSTLIHPPYYYNLQFMKNENEEYVVTDINLRSAGGMSMSYKAGWDVVSALAHIMLNHPLDVIINCVPVNTPECYVVRHYEDVVTKTESIIGMDLDGTLIDSRERHIAVLKKILDKERIKLNIDDLIEYKREGRNNIDYLISKGLSEKTSRKIQTDWIEQIEWASNLELDCLYPYALSLLEYLSKMNKLILITARTNKNGLQQELDNLGISSFFYKLIVVNHDNIVEEKAKALVENKISTYYGDTKSDYNACKKAGSKFIFFKDGFHSEEYVFDLEPKHHIT